MPSETFSISDVSQQTGVASITLRAWERRYGLVKPQRTPKGHRVYTQQNIEEIKQIVVWLNRGVTISKVAPLLVNNELSQQPDAIEQHWHDHVQELLLALTQLKLVTANQLCDKLTKSLPFYTLCQQVFLPLDVMLNERWQQRPLGYELEQQLWQQLWQRQMTLMSLRADKQKARAKCWLVNLKQGATQTHYWLLYGLLLQSGIRVHAITADATINSLTRLEHQTERALIVFADSRLDATSLKKLSGLAVNWQSRLLCVGAAVAIHKQQLQQYKVHHQTGNSCELWSSTSMQNWLQQIESA